MLLTEASGCAHPCLSEGNDGYAGPQQQNKIGVGYSAFMQGMLQAFFTSRLEIFGCIFNCELFQIFKRARSHQTACANAIKRLLFV